MDAAMNVNGDLPTPIVQASKTRVVAQQEGEASAEPPHRKMEIAEMTPDKAPSNSPMWYQLALNASFATLVAGAFIWNMISTPSADTIQKNAAALTERLIDRTLNGQDRLIEKHERLAAKQEANNAEMREIFRERMKFETARAEALTDQFRTLLEKADKHHEEARKDRETARKVSEDLAAAVNRLANKMP
jgi:chromosome condensin MukBEF ATPase and DNA-binding subunit MukB